MKTAIIAKITRPKLSGSVKRDRLFHLLDQGKQKPVIWVAAQGGSGKTTLVADWLDSRKLPCLWYQVDEGDADIASFFYYMGMAAKNAATQYKKSLPLLTPEYLQGISVFTRRYFEELFRRIKSPSVVVLDNYQDVPLASGFHDMVALGMDTIPEGITLVILSRIAPPPQFARFQANSRLHSIGWDDVRFTREESRGLLEMQAHNKPSSETLELLYKKTDGWVAGMILITESLRLDRLETHQNLNTAGSLFNYFVSEIFSKTEAPIQDVLLKTSFLQKIDPAMAEKLTGNAMAGHILEHMSQNHYFTHKYGQAYQYHPLFREFLQSRMSAFFSFADIVAIQKKTAELLEQAGSNEAAIALYIDAADWAGAERVVLGEAQSLVSQGRSNTLEAWLNKLPREIIGISPWALYWLGVCRIAYDPAEARGYFEEAFLSFKKEKNVSGTFLSWAYIVDTFVYEWGDFSPLDHWITVADKLVADHPEFPSSEIEARVAAGMLSAMTYRQHYHAELPVWAERVRQIVLKHPSIQMRMMLGNYLIIYYLWVDDLAKAGLMIETMRPVSGLKENDPLTKQHWYVMEAMYSFFMADNNTCMQVIAQGLKNAQESGIHLLDLYLLGQGVYSGVSLGNPSAAKIFLGQMATINSPRMLDKSFYHYQASSVSWHDGDLKKSIEHGTLAVKLAENVGTPLGLALCLVELASILFDDGQHEEASSCLKRGAENGRGINFIVYVSFLHGARFAFERGNEQHGLVLLKQGMAQGSQQGYVNMPRWNDKTMSRLCAKALEHDIEPGYVRKLISTRGLVPGGAVANWPYPIRIHTLGRFELLKDDKLVTFTGKAQKKPVELLKALIAMGGQDVSDVRLVDALWPDSEGDAGYGALKTTILRLRQLLGCDDAVLVSGGAVSLDSRICYVDAFAFDELIQEAELQHKQQKTHDPQSAIALKISDVYKGRFLAADIASIWAASLRERLQNKFLRFSLKAGKALEEQDRWADAIELYHRSLESDDLHEEFYQRLMSCHLKLGQQAEAVSTYRRCKKTLFKTFDATLSDLTETLYQTALKH